MRAYYRTTDKDITFFWEIEEGAEKGGVYTVNVSGVGTFETKVTHFTVHDLRPDTEYKAEIFFKGQKVSLSPKTLPQIEYIDITKAPYFAAGDG
ncbi:MAG: hypothetical protein II688_07885, partial [Lachnospiraceae bacterium]|nr:hypothetical protein [Lachnospiraceae bacterium]